MSKAKIQIITPPVASSGREMDLVNLTEYLIKNGFAEYCGGGLGGEYGYGCYFENEIFSLFPYYWGECDCGADDYNEQLGGNCDVTELKDHSEDCSLMKSNFHYKPTDFMVDWYKWIGRGMDYSDEISDEEWRKMFGHCLDSLRMGGKMSNFTLKGKLKAWRKSLAMNGVPWLKEDADAYSQLIRLANHDLGLFEVCEWWIKKYPPDIFVESPEEIVKIRKQMQIMLKARDDFVR